MEKVAAFLLCLLLALPLAGCRGAQTPQPLPPLEEPISLIFFSFSHSGSSTDEIYSLTAEKNKNGTHIYMTPGAGSRTADVLVEEDVLKALGETAAEHRLDMWNGFEGKKSNVSDGEGFSLEMTTDGGEHITARGSNSFPAGYREAEAEIKTLLKRLAYEYGDIYPKTLESDEPEYFSLTLRDGYSRVLSATAKRAEGERVSIDLHVKGYGLFEEEYFFRGHCGSFPFEELQGVVRRYDVPRWNGWDFSDAQSSASRWFQLELVYAGGETIACCGSLHPEGYGGASAEFEQILVGFIKENSGSFVSDQ